MFEIHKYRRKFEFVTEVDKTYGALDMGGASMQISYSCPAGPDLV